MPTQIPIPPKVSWTGATIATLIWSLSAAVMISAIELTIVWAYNNLSYPSDPQALTCPASKARSSLACYAEIARPASLAQAPGIGERGTFAPPAHD
jgi:hypothetical protein